MERIAILTGMEPLGVRKSEILGHTLRTGTEKADIEFAIGMLLGRIGLPRARRLCEVWRLRLRHSGPWISILPDTPIAHTPSGGLHTAGT